MHVLRWLPLLLIAISARADAPNVLLITVDDMSCGSVGAFGGRVADATPNIDRLATQGMRFEHAFVTVAICQPTRAVWMTGRYPHNNGALGFEPIDAGVPTLVAALRAAGYRTGLMAKTGHVIPSRAAEFDTIVTARELRNGRDPERYHQHAAAFLAGCAAEERSFFLMANAQDPHRPFVGSRQEQRFRERDATSRSPHYGGGFPDVSVSYTPAQVEVPGFLPDLPEVRAELAEYYTSVRRADQTVGALLRALDESGLADDTLVVFVSDHGLPMPYAKTNCYRASTRTPWIVRWPDVVAGGSVDRTHLISGIDLAPTILEATGVDPLPNADGRSIVPLLRGDTQGGRDRVFTQIDTLSSRRAYPMRAVEEKRYGYIWNGWSDGTRRFRNSAMGGLTFPAMRDAARSDAAIAERVRHFLHRTPEELYDYALDPSARRNLAVDPVYGERLRSMRRALLVHMVATGDPQYLRFRAFLDAEADAAPPDLPA